MKLNLDYSRRAYLFKQVIKKQKKTPINPSYKSAIFPKFLD